MSLQRYLEKAESAEALPFLFQDESLHMDASQNYRLAILQRCSRQNRGNSGHVCLDKSHKLIKGRTLQVHDDIPKFLGVFLGDE